MPYQLPGDKICTKCKLVIDGFNKISLYFITGNGVVNWHNVDELLTCNEYIIKNIIE